MQQEELVAEAREAREARRQFAALLETPGMAELLGGTNKNSNK